VFQKVIKDRFYVLQVFSHCIKMEDVCGGCFVVVGWYLVNGAVVRGIPSEIDEN
jgi:hypothetical protein